MQLGGKASRTMPTWGQAYKGACRMLCQILGCKPRTRPPQQLALTCKAVSVTAGQPLRRSECRRLRWRSEVPTTRSQHTRRSCSSGGDCGLCLEGCREADGLPGQLPVCSPKGPGCCCTPPTLCCWGPACPCSAACTCSPAWAGCSLLLPPPCCAGGSRCSSAASVSEGQPASSSWRRLPRLAASTGASWASVR